MYQTKKSVRLKYFIRSGMQFKFLRVNILLAIFISLAVALPICQLSINILGAGLEEIYPPELLNEIYKKFISTLGVYFLVIISVVIIATILISHHIAGAAYHIERDLASMADGNFTKRIYLRKHDEIKPIANQLNKMADMVSRNLNSIGKNLEALEKLCQELKDSGSDSSKQDISENLTASLKGIRDAFSKFKIK